MTAYVLFLVVGLCAGFASALLGIGGGVIMVPTLTFVFAKGWGGHAAGFPAIKLAAVTSLAYIVPVALAGAVRSRAPVQWEVVALAVPAGIVGAYLGALTKEHISAAHLKIVFAILMLAVSLRLGLTGWRETRAAAPAAGAQETTESPSERSDAG